MVPGHQVDQPLRDGGGGDEADVQEGQVAKEEVHGAVEPGVCPGDEDDEAIHGHGKAVEGQEEGKERFLSGRRALLRVNRRINSATVLPLLRHAVLDLLADGGQEQHR